MDEWWVEATIKVKYLFKGEGYKDEETVVALEAGELEVMLDKDVADCLYTDNQIARFDEVEVVEIKATKKEELRK
jgi:hypothetical protein